MKYNNLIFANFFLRRLAITTLDKQLLYKHLGLTERRIAKETIWTKMWLRCVSQNTENMNAGAAIDCNQNDI